MATNNKSGLFVGKNKGHLVTLPAKQAWKTRPVTTKGKISKRALAVREVINEIAGFSPLEKKMLELIRTGVAAKEKKAVKTARAKLGTLMPTHRRAQIKRTALVTFVQQSKRK